MDKLKLSKKIALQFLEEDRIKQIMDMKAHREYLIDEARKERYKKNFQKGRKEGIQIGLEKGIQEGRKEGIEKGLQEARMNLIKNMLASGATVDDIAKLTRIKPQEILEIKNNG